VAPFLLALACGTGNDLDPGATGAGGDGSGAGGMGTGGGSAGSGGGAGGMAGTGSGGGRGGAGGAAGHGGAGGTAGTSGGNGGTGGVSTTAPACSGSTAALTATPFGCGFAWGRNTANQLSQFSYLQFVSDWIGSEIRADGTLNGCSGCKWLQTVASTNLVPVYYAYIIGFYGHANGLPDGNSGGPPNLTTGGANLIRNNRSKIIAAYTSYAQQSHAVWGTKPLVWLLEGDFVQYTGTSETNALSMTELAQLAADITCAIKSNMPNAVVAINHSTWNADDVTNSFWNAMDGAAYYDLVWTSGAATTTGYFDPAADKTTYNSKTASYAYVHKLTGRNIFVDTSFGASAMGDTWTTAAPATINARIADGVIAANVTTPPSNYQTAIGNLGTLAGTCN
jgi:hypothetical protein